MDRYDLWTFLTQNCIFLCGGLTLASNQTPTHPLAQSPLMWDWEEIEGR